MAGFVKKQDIEIVRASGVIDEKWYLEQYPDVALLGMDPVEHYLWIGQRLNRRPSPNKVAASNAAPVPNAVVSGEKSLATPHDFVAASPFFDRAWYAEKYKDHLKEGEEPVSHYLRSGSHLGYDPGPRFSTARYLDIYRDVKVAKINPLFHYEKYGKKEGRSPRPTPRNAKGGMMRFTPPEGGEPNKVLAFDAPPQRVAGIEAERICLHLHLFFVDMARDIAGYLANIRHPFQLLVSVQEDQDPKFWEAFFSAHVPAAESVVVRAFPNRGRDVAPWVVGFADHIRNSTIFAHIHTKRSNHNRSHAGWFRFLSHSMLGSYSIVDSILEMFCSDKALGLVGPCYHWTLADQPNYGKNISSIQELYRRLGSQSQLPDSCPDYPAGSFFWSRTSILERLFDIGLTWEDFPEENGLVDGTHAHGVERLMGILPSLSGKTYKMVTVDVPYDLTRFIHDRRSRLSPALIRKTSIQKPIGGSRGKKIALYSCVSGGYEKTIPLIRSSEGIDCFLFSDSDNVEAPEGYKTVKCQYISDIPVRTARFVKTHPHLYFSEYDYAIWCDSNVHFLGDIYQYIDELEMSGSDCSFILHPVRDNCVEEAEELIGKGRLPDVAVAERQIETYLEMGEALLKSRLLETNFFICKPGEPRVARFMGAWWAEINKYTHRDQLSVNCALRQSGVKVTPLIPDGRSARDHDDFMIFSHSVQDRKFALDFFGSAYHA